MVSTVYSVSLLQRFELLQWEHAAHIQPPSKPAVLWVSNTSALAFHYYYFFTFSKINMMNNKLLLPLLTWQSSSQQIKLTTLHKKRNFINSKNTSIKIRFNFIYTRIFISKHHTSHGKNSPVLETESQVCRNSWNASIKRLNIDDFKTSRQSRTGPPQGSG